MRLNILMCLKGYEWFCSLSTLFLTITSISFLFKNVGYKSHMVRMLAVFDLASGNVDIVIVNELQLTDDC